MNPSKCRFQFTSDWPSRNSEELLVQNEPLSLQYSIARTTRRSSPSLTTAPWCWLDSVIALVVFLLIAFFMFVGHYPLAFRVCRPKNMTNMKEASENHRELWGNWKNDRMGEEEGVPLLPYLNCSRTTREGKTRSASISATRCKNLLSSSLQTSVFTYRWLFCKQAKFSVSHFLKQFAVITF